MPISVHVHLLSGKSASLEVEVDASVQSLKNRAQSALMVPARGRLLKPSGEVLDSAQTIKQARLESGDMLTLQVSRQAQLQATKPGIDAVAFAAILGDGSVVAWGWGHGGGGSSGVQERLRDVQQIRASSKAFAAILGDGSVIAWGGADSGGDSSAVQRQLTNVQQIQASRRAFAAVLRDGSVVTWGKKVAVRVVTAVSVQASVARNVKHIQACFGSICCNPG